MFDNKKWIYRALIIAMIGFSIYTIKDIIVYAGERDKLLTKCANRIDNSEEELSELKKDTKKFQRIQNKMNNEINKKLASIETIIKLLADKEGIRY